MRTPISYYGGKQNMAARILPLIPRHTTYVEPFLGGGAILFAKPTSIIEVVNDLNDDVINFFTMCRDNFDELNNFIQHTVHSEAQYREAKQKLSSANNIERAWAFWVQTNMSYAKVIGGGFAFSLAGGEAGATTNKVREFTMQLHRRLSRVTLFSRDAIDVIMRYDSTDAFMYFDPPYAESDCGHYEDGKDVYYRLLELLPSLKCKWLLSSYPSEELNTLRTTHGYFDHDIKKVVKVTGRDTTKYKVECLTHNYKLDTLW